MTKSGTNEFHGAAYAFHRNTVTSANDFFNNRGGVERPKLIRNIFGGALGGPIIRNRAFFFGNFEGRTDRSDQNVLREVPLSHMRRGAIRYLNTAGGVTELSPLELRRIDPLGLGASPALLAVLNQMPEANDESGGDGVNTGGYRFTAPTPLTWKTYIARLDWSLDNAGRHLLFARGNLQNDRVSGAPQFPGQPPATVQLTKQQRARDWVQRGI